MVEYVGFDVSKEETAFCVKDAAGEVLARGKVSTDPRALFEALRAHCLYPGRIVLETGTLSGWLARELGGLGVGVDVIDARQANAVMRLQHNKTDANDAELLAEIARTGFCRPVAVKSAAAQASRALLKARCHLVRQRRDTQNTMRGLLGSLGIRFPKGSGKLAGRVREALEGRPELRVVIEPLLSTVAALEREIGRLDKAVVARAKGAPACRLLMSVPGVGPVTALAYVSTIGDAERFANSRAVGAYVGLTSRRWQSGGMDYSGRISKHGDAMLRALLYEAANSLLTVVRRAHPLKDWARRIRKRTSHKKACVALARRLAVILHRMLITGEAFRWPAKKESVTA
ncbi:MAG: IS110 family transposase [Candidatus Brocadiia bacterium]|jgi:transposase|nr:IS110 family transposase [Candidatus Brocadiia bacterium]HJN93061.1 IS110 family transposase [Dehalococcoidia bacterium]